MTDDDAARRHAALLAEHAGMQEKIRHATLDLYRTETIIPLAIAAIFAWLYGDGQDASRLPRWILAIPVALTILGAARQFMRYKYLGCAHGYLKLLERKLYPAESDGDLGWEAYWEKNDTSRHKWMRILFWSLLGVATLVLAVQGPPARTPSQAAATPALTKS